MALHQQGGAGTDPENSQTFYFKLNNKNKCKIPLDLLGKQNRHTPTCDLR